MQPEEENKKLPERPPPPKKAVESTANRNSPKFPRKEGKSVNSNTITKNASPHNSSSPKAGKPEQSQAGKKLQQQQTGKPQAGKPIPSQLGKSVPQPQAVAERSIPQQQPQPQTGKPISQQQTGKPLQQPQSGKPVPQQVTGKPLKQQTGGIVPQEQAVKPGPQQPQAGKPVPQQQQARKPLPQQQQAKTPQQQQVGKPVQPAPVIPTIQINKGAPASQPEKYQETTNRYNNGEQKAPETAQTTHQPALSSNPAAPRPTAAPPTIPKAKPQQQIQSFTQKLFNSIPRAPNSPSGSKKKK